jgi:outer membrane protein
MLRLGRVIALAAMLAAMASAQVKIAIINSQQAVVGTAEFKKWQGEAEARFKPRQDQLQKLQKDIQDIQAQLQGGKLNQTGEQELQAQAAIKQRQGQRLQQDLQEEADREQNETLQRIGKRMKDLVTKLATEKGYDAVFDASSTVFYKPAMDLTSEAVAGYDKAYPLK